MKDFFLVSEEMVVADMCQISLTMEISRLSDGKEHYVVMFSTHGENSMQQNTLWL